jgi:hypothetical protein
VLEGEGCPSESFDCKQMNGSRLYRRQEDESVWIGLICLNVDRGDGSGLQFFGSSPVEAKSSDAHFHVIDNDRTDPTSSTLVCQYLDYATALIRH